MSIERLSNVKSIQNYDDDEEEEEEAIMNVLGAMVVGGVYNKQERKARYDIVVLYIVCVSHKVFPVSHLYSSLGYACLFHFHGVGKCSVWRGSDLKKTTRCKRGNNIVWLVKTTLRTTVL
jgi:hypothetical protein